MRPILVQVFFVICMFCPLVSMAEVRWAEREDGACAIRESRNSGYVDTPYVVRAPDGSWVSILTVGDGKEGSPSQHLQVFRSMDLCEWEHISTLEPKGGPEASWGMPFLYQERLCVAYTYNSRNIRVWPLSDRSKARKRVDMLGDLRLRCSDDSGRHWANPITIPIKRTEIDLKNGFNGKEVIFWLSGHPRKIGESICIGLSKGGVSYAKSILPETQAFLYCTNNIRDKESWNLVGPITCPNKCGVAEEPSFIELSTGYIYVVFRTNSGLLGAAVIKDGKIVRLDWARYKNGRRIRNPRGPAYVWRTKRGKYLLWFYNNDGTEFSSPRNPVYIAIGTEDNNTIHWDVNIHKILVATDTNGNVDSKIRIGYPTIVEHDGALWVTASDKRRAYSQRLDLIP